MKDTEEYKQMTELSHSSKVTMTKARIRQWLAHYGEDNVYVYVEGTRANMILLDIIHNMCLNIATSEKPIRGKYPMLSRMMCKDKDAYNIWMEYGCNAYDRNPPISLPMAFWTMKDVKEELK